MSKDLSAADLHIEAAPENLLHVQAFVDRVLENAGFAQRQRQLCAVAVEEAFVNICSYAGTDDVAVSLSGCGSAVRITFLDRGRPFNPLTGTAPDLTLPAEERQAGGLGIHLIRTIADEVSYTRADGANILALTLTRKDVDT